MKVEMVRSTDSVKFRKEINKFIKDKKVIDIKFNQLSVPIGTFFKRELELVVTAFIMYED